MTPSTDYTIDELISVCICRQIVNGEVVAQGIATPLVMAGILLAKLTHGPDIWFALGVGGTLCRDWSPLGLTSIEKPWLDHGLLLMPFTRITCEFLPRFNVREFFRPAQVDACGNFNNVFIGGDYARPQMRLPGSGGIPDVTIFDNHAMLYVPRHSRAVFANANQFSIVAGGAAGTLAPSAFRNITLRFAPTGATTIDVTYEFLSDDRTVDRGVPSESGLPFAGDRRAFFGNPDASFSEVDVHAGDFAFAHAFGDALTMRNHLRVADYDKYYQNMHANSPVAANGDVALQAYFSGTRRRNFFNQTDLTWEMETGGIAHTILIGGEFGSQDTDNLRSRRNLLIRFGNSKPNPDAHSCRL